jgi:hypothetical protein
LVFFSYLTQQVYVSRQFLFRSINSEAEKASLEFRQFIIKRNP